MARAMLDQRALLDACVAAVFGNLPDDPWRLLD